LENPEKLVPGWLLVPVWLIPNSMVEVKQLTPEPDMFVQVMRQVPKMPMLPGPAGPLPPQASIATRNSRGVNRRAQARIGSLD
jgi:hypothetical protein